MSKPLDTKKLKELCEAVIRDIGSDTSIPLAADWNWARLEHESLPELENFLADDAITATQQATIERLTKELDEANHQLAIVTERERWEYDRVMTPPAGFKGRSR